MASMDNQSLKPSKEQIIYANLLLMGMLAGIAIMTITYTIYVSGILSSHIDMSVIAANWGKGWAPCSPTAAPSMKTCSTRSKQP